MTAGSVPPVPMNEPARDPSLPPAGLATRHLRRDIIAMSGYTPGEQVRDCIKLNTNESAWGPSPRLRDLLRQVADDQLRLYPDPVFKQLRATAASRYGVSPDMVRLSLVNLYLHGFTDPHIYEYDTLTSEERWNEYADVILANPPFGGIVANNNETNFPQNFRTKESADLFLILMIHLLKMGGRAGIVLPDGSLTGEGVKQRVRERLLTECNLHTIIRLPNSVFQPYATVATNLLFFDKGTPTREIWYYEHRLPEGQKSYSKTKSIRPEEFQPIKDWWNNRRESEVCWKVHIEAIKERNYDLDIKNPHKVEEDHEYSSRELFGLLDESLSKSHDLLNQMREAVR